VNHELRLRPPTVDDEAEVRAAHDALMRSDRYPFCLFWRHGMSWTEYVDLLERYRRGEGLTDGMVPSTFLVAEVDGTIVGRASLRHRLSPSLERDGGHVGYGVLPAHRRRGHATTILQQSLVILRSLGVGDVLVTCDDGNVGSATVIERCGGKLDSVIRLDSGSQNRRYWIH
jgi:predicted acetyltransferase